LGRNHLREQLRSWGALVLLTHAPGEAQVDFDQVLVAIGGVKQTAHYLPMATPHFAGCFVVALRVGP